MPKRISRESAKDRKCSSDMTDGDSVDKPIQKKKRTTSRGNIEENTLWIKDDTLDDDSDYVPSDEEEEEEEEEQTGPVYIIIKPQSHGDDEECNCGEQSEDDDEFISYLKEKYVPEQLKQTKKQQPKKKQDKPALKLNRHEQKYFDALTPDQRLTVLDQMKRIATHVIDDGDVPYKFKILNLPISDYMKSLVIKKATALADMPLDSGESYKLRNWMDGFLRLPFGKTIPLPVKFEDGTVTCSQFMVNARKDMDKHVYGMQSAKTQIMQTIAQWIVNPEATGNVIALQGAMGVGKTSFARNAIASVLQRPFEFFSLGGASDIANFVGHSYTYEGSTWGRIADALMHSRTMNPVLYFDELDKVSTTPHGEEIISMLIHLTDRSQNSQFHDRYFSGVDMDVSQCLFVFSFNDIEKVNPILRDRMTVITCPGYSKNEKQIIMKEYVLPSLLDKLRFTKDDIKITDDAISYLIDSYSEKESGIRTLIRVLEIAMTRLNMLRIANNDESMKDYEFYMDIAFPLTINEKVFGILLKDYQPKQPETWRHMYV